MDATIPLDALIRIQMEYVEMPGLKLTPHQIGRLCGLPRDICDGALGLLAERGFSANRETDRFDGPTVGKPAALPPRTTSRSSAGSSLAFSWGPLSPRP